jgi:sugar lactone lactonase YvrE
MNSTRWIVQVFSIGEGRFHGVWRKLTVALFGALAVAGVAAAQTIPVAVVSQSKLVVASVNGNAGHIAANTAGDLFYVSQGDNTAYWLPRGSTHPVALMTGLQGARSVYVDASNNVFVGNPYAGTPTIIEDPYVNGTYATGIAYSSVSACSSTTPTSPCVQFGTGGSVTSYYYQALDLGFDAAGNAYVIDTYSNTNPAGPGKANSILKWTNSGGKYTASYISQLLPDNYNAQIAVSPNGDVYYADGSNLYYIPNGSTTATIITTAAMTDPAGVSTDQYGDVFVTNSNTPYAILEIPAVNGVAQQNKIFTFSQGYSANGVAFDKLGDYFYTGYSSTTNINEGRLFSFPLGSAVVGTPVSATPSTINLLFTATVTPATIALSNSSSGLSYIPGTCVAGTTYNSGSSCTITVNATPTAVGLQKDAVVFADASGNSLVSVFLSSIGLGAAQTNDPGTLTSIGSGFKTPQSIAVDSANNVYIADPGQNAVQMYASGSSTPVSIGTGLVSPTSVAVDNGGNVFIADSGNGRIVEVPDLNGTVTNSAQSVIATSYTGPATSSGAGVTTNLGTMLGITLGPNGSLYVADANNANVVQYASVDGIPNASQNSIVTGLTNKTPIAVTTDSTGDLFVADSTANTVVEQQYYGKSVVNIGSGYSDPSGLATDAAGSLYVADTGNARLLKIPFESPIYNTNDEYRVDAGIAAPYGVALDSAANLYVVDSAHAAAYEINRSQGTLPLGRANINQPTSTINGYISDAGNQALQLGTPDYVATGNTSVFTITSPSPNGCANGESISAGYSCVLQASFDSSTTGNFTELLSFNSNALNTATPSIALTATGLNLTATTLSLQQVGTTSFGQPVVVKATISSTLAGTPTGQISFTVDGAPVGTYTVNGDTLQVSINGVTGGPHTIGASYTGDNTYAPSNTTASISVIQAGSTVSIVATGTNVFQNPVSAGIGTSITFTATVTPGASTIPTGTVKFTAGGVTLGTASVVPSNTPGVYVATLSSAALPAGTNTVVATYSGDVNYISSSGTLTVVTGPMTYTLTAASSTLTVGRAASGTISFQVSSLAGYTGYVGLYCTGLPANTVCGFSPNGFILQPSNLLTVEQQNAQGVVIVPATYAPTTVTLTVVTGTTPPVPQPPVGTLSSISRKLPFSLAFLALAPVTLIFRRRAAKKFCRATSLLFALLLFAGSMSLTGCGNNLIGNTPAGTYNVTVTATSVASGYTGSLAPGCALSAPSSTATTPTCTQVATFKLVVQ